MFSMNVEVSEARRQDLLREAEHAQLVREARQERRDNEAQRSNEAQIESETERRTQPNLQRQYAK
jgi:hypothetical protein